MGGTGMDKKDIIVSVCGFILISLVFLMGIVLTVEL